MGRGNSVETGKFHGSARNFVACRKLRALLITDIKFGQMLQAEHLRLRLNILDEGHSQKFGLEVNLASSP